MQGARVMHGLTPRSFSLTLSRPAIKKKRSFIILLLKYFLKHLSREQIHLSQNLVLRLLQNTMIIDCQSGKVYYLHNKFVNYHSERNRGVSQRCFTSFTFRENANGQIDWKVSLLRIMHSRGIGSWWFLSLRTDEWKKLAKNNAIPIRQLSVFSSS